MYEQIQDQIKQAMREKNAVRLNTLRGVSAAVTTELKKTGANTISDGEVVAIIKRLVKQRKDSIEQFEKGGRQDLVDSEKAELKILEEFLPAQMSEEEIRKIVNGKMERLGIKDKSQMGLLMKEVMKECGGKADGAMVKKIAEKLIG